MTSSATRNTTTYYTSPASVCIVADGVDQSYTATVNVGSTATHYLSAYAYTDGSAVTTADLDLWYDSGALTTTFTSVGGGWYQLTGSFTGVASDKTYGVLVKSGKTVYVDSLSLSAAAPTTTLYISNSGLQGTANVDVEGSVTASNFVSDVAVGTQPYATTSTTVNTNLNADLLDGSHVGTSGATIPLLNAANTWSAAQTLSDVNLVLTATTGTKIGTATTQKLAFFNSTPIVQPVNTVAIDTLLVNLGLRASGGVANFATVLQSAGRVRAVSTKTTTYVITTADETIVGNSATAFTVTLPAATGSGRVFTVKNINTGAVTVDGNSSDTIDGQLTQVLGQWDAIQVVDYAANAWVII